jgi:hypothetical protein
MYMNIDSVDIPLVLFWISMTATVVIYGVWAWSSIKRPTRTK